MFKIKSLTNLHIGHGLFVFGALMFLISAIILMPINSGQSKAFGVSDIISLTNQSRNQLGHSALHTDTSLMNAAQMKAEDMAKGHYFAHTAPDGTVAWDYFKKVSYSYSVAGENLAITNVDAQAVIDGWLNSPTHRNNMLSDQYTNMGIGMAPYGSFEGHANTYVIVAFYGKSAAIQSSSATTNPAGTSSIFKPFISGIPPAALISVAAIFMLAGGLLEFRHIGRLHHSSHLA